MKKFNAISAVFLCFILLFSLASPAFAADSSQDLPIIYVRGQGGTLYDGNGDVLGFNPDKAELTANITNALANAYLTKNFDKVSTLLSKIISSIFPPLDEYGDAFPGENAGNHTFSGKKSNFTVNDYSFSYDWRLDPIYNSELLAQFIDKVLEYTGKNKVALVGFSEGSCICSAYLTYHGNENKVDSFTMISPGCNSIDVVGALAAGKAKISADTIEKFATYYVEGGDLLGNSDLESLISVLAGVLKSSVLQFGADFLQSLYNNINRTTAFLDIALGGYPGFWSFVGDEYYADAIEKNFGGREAENAALIAKIEKYHNEVYENLDDTLLSLKANGLKIYDVAKYGSASFPIVEGGSVQSDGVIELHNTSFGATCAKLGKTLTNVDENSKYVSADKVIDASTCLFKDSTWFVEGIVHGTETQAIDDFVTKLTKSSTQVTVDDDLYPQFLHYDKASGALAPLEEKSTTSKIYANNFFSRLAKFIKSFIGIIKGWFEKLAK